MTSLPPYCFSRGHVTLLLLLLTAGRHLPSWFRSIAPKTALEVHEESWNAYPYTKTKFSVPYVEKFSLEIETKFEADNGCQVRRGWMRGRREGVVSGELSERWVGGWRGRREEVVARNKEAGSGCFSGTLECVLGRKLVYNNYIAGD